MTFQISNYHSKEAVVKALKAGKKVKLTNVPLNRAQQLANREAELKNLEPPFKTESPLPYASYDITCSQNKQVKIWEASVLLNGNCEVVLIS